MNPALFGLIISALAAVGGVLGVVLSGVGKRGDQRATQTSDQFKRLMEEIAYWHTAATDARGDLQRCLDGLPPDAE